MYPLLHSSWTVESDLYIQTFTVCICQFIIPFWEDPNAFQCIVPYLMVGQNMDIQAVKKR